MRFGNAQLPRKSGIAHTGARRSTRSAVIAGNEDDIRASFGNTDGNRADTGLRYQLHADTSVAVRIFQIMNELCQILDRINIMMRRR